MCVSRTHTHTRVFVVEFMPRLTHTHTLTHLHIVHVTRSFIGMTHAEKQHNPFGVRTQELVIDNTLSAPAPTRALLC